MPEANGHLSGAVSYAQYGNRLSMLTALDVGAMADAFVTLARDEELRKKMGQAALARARKVYDWSAVIPQMQDFWAELDLENFEFLTSDDLYWKAYLSSLKIAVTSTLMTLVVGYPIAYGMSRAPDAWRPTLLHVRLHPRQHLPGPVQLLTRS